MRNVRHHPMVHDFSHGAEKVIELVEDMRPTVHIFFADIFPPILVMAIMVGVFKVATANRGRINAPFFRTIAVVNSVGGTTYGPVMVHFRHHGLH
jgi:hypothetical protein